jgi:hypothetical protein
MTWGIWVLSLVWAVDVSLAGSICSVAYPRVPTQVCMARVLFVSGFFTLALPLLLTWSLERRARSLFLASQRIE